jgi:hypothetical protein
VRYTSAKMVNAGFSPTVVDDLLATVDHAPEPATQG